MSTGTPWSVKGIDAEARSVAKELARRSGMTLGEWLNQMILEGRDVSAELAAGLEAVSAPVAEAEPAQRSVPRSEPRSRQETLSRLAGLAARHAGRKGASRDRDAASAEVDPVPAPVAPSYDSSARLGQVAEAIETLGARLENSEARSAQAVRGVSQAVEALLGRLERSEARVSEQERVITGQVEEMLASVEQLSRTEESAVRTMSDRLSSQGERLETLAGLVRDDRDRLGALQSEIESVKSSDKMAAVEGALGSLAGQLYEDKTRAHASIADVRQDMVSISHRLAQLELRDPQKEAQALIDQVVTRMAQRLESAEARTQASIRGLEQAFAGLDARLIRAERVGAEAQSTQSLAKLAGDLSARMDEARNEMISAVENATRSRPSSNIEGHLEAIAEQIASVEKRSAGAIEQMGREVVRIAENLNNRVESVENRAEAEAGRIDRLQGEVSQATARTERSLEAAATAQAHALERLGGEIARISERLSARLNDAERRAGAAMGEINSRIERGQESASSEFAERIRASEVRTQKLLEEARHKMDTHLGQGGLKSLQTRPVPEPEITAGLPNPFAVTDAPRAPVAETEVREMDAPARSFTEATPRPVTAFEDLPPVFEEPVLATELSVKMDRPRAFDPFADARSGAVAGLVSRPGARVETRSKAEPAPRDGDLDITGRLLSGLTDFIADAPVASSPTVRADVQADPEADDFGDMPDFLETEAETATDISDDPFGDAPAQQKAAHEPMVSAPVATFVDDEDDLEEDPFADIDAARKAAPEKLTLGLTRDALAGRAAMAPEPATVASRAEAIGDIFDRDLDVPSAIDDVPFSETPVAPSGARQSTRDALMSARAAVQASIEGSASKKGAGVSLGVSSKPAKPALNVKPGGSLLGRLIKTTSVSVAAVTVLGGSIYAAKTLFAPGEGSRIPGGATEAAKTGTEDGMPFAAVLNTPAGSEGANASLSSEDRINDLYKRATTALKARDPNALAKLQTVANLGHAMAQYELALIYDGRTNGYTTDKKQARQWYTRAADSGQVEAMYNLALLNYSGEGGRVDYAQAANLFRRAADRGYRDAQYNLATLYLQGRGVSKSSADAYKWYLIAAHAGDSDAAQKVRDLGGQLSEGQRALAESEASRFRASSESAVVIAQN